MLVERDTELAALRAAAAATVRGGRIVLVAGEAGIGKTALVQRFLDDLPARSPVLQGWCQPLSTPQPLAPVMEIAAQAAGTLAETAQRGATAPALGRALMDLLAERPSHVLVMEDVHWADDASLDVARFVCRRIGAVRALVVLTYRDDELGGSHPLRVLLGELARTRSTSRLALAPLSRAAVEVMAGERVADLGDLYRRTGGNPFFVTESLAAGAGVPETVRDAVLARAVRLSPGARRALDCAAVIGSSFEFRWLEDAAGSDASWLDECVSVGMVRENGGTIEFRHELARTVVEEAIPPVSRRALHDAVFRVLLADGASDARLAHHADAAGDRRAAVRHAARAAEQAARLGAHHEAAAQYQRALRSVPPDDVRTRATLLQRCSEECALSDQSALAVACADEALAMWRAEGDRLREGDVLRWRARLAWMSDRAADALRIGREAITVLERLPESPELAHAYATLGRQHALDQDLDEARPLVERALATARRSGDPALVALSRIDLGLVKALGQEPGGMEMLAAQVAEARELGLDEHAAKGMFQLARVRWGFLDYVGADQFLLAAETFCSDRGVEIIRDYVLALRAEIRLGLGDWAQAEELATGVWQRRTPASPTIRNMFAGLALGLVRARRGIPADGVLGQVAAHGATLPVNAVQLGVPAALAESAWLAGRRLPVDELRAAAVRARADRVNGPLRLAELSWWRQVAGEDVTAEGDGPFLAQLSGDWRAAAESWEVLGLPYHRALALAAAPGERPLREALEICRTLGAVPLGRRVARRLRVSGVRNIPRLRSPKRGDHDSAGLTSRELDVLPLLSEGLRNKEIAAHLVLSERTVHHHVSEILRKLGVHSRGAAVAKAKELNWP
jgi:DNA-binding CsgD family transcriptional regulator/tetratricopeptide (TPR) repeat protein